MGAKLPRAKRAIFVFLAKKGDVVGENGDVVGENSHDVAVFSHDVAKGSGAAKIQEEKKKKRRRRREKSSIFALFFFFSSSFLLEFLRRLSPVVISANPQKTRFLRGSFLMEILPCWYIQLRGMNLSRTGLATASLPPPEGTLRSRLRWYGR